MRKLLILWTILAFCLSTVSALQVSSPSLGGSAVNPESDVSTTFTVTNNDNVVLTNFVIASNADAKYKVTFENKPVSLAPGNSAVVTLKAFVPKDFGAGKKQIGSVTVTASTPVAQAPAQNISQNITQNTSNSTFGTHNFTSPQNQTPQQVSIPVGMSAANDCGENTPALNSSIIGQWHTGSCDWKNDIEVKYPVQGAVDAGWVRLHSDQLNNYWVSTIAADCGGSSQNPPNGWLNGGRIHTGPGLCDNQIELPSADSGWMGFYTNPDADGKIILVIAEDACGGGVQTVPVGGVVLGKVKTGPGACDGAPEAYSYTGTAIDSGSMFVVYLPIDHTPVNSLPIGTFESLSWTSLSGWAFDANAPSISVHVWVDGTFWKQLEANQPHTGLNFSGDHGFSYTFTAADLASLNTSKNHTFNILAINSPSGDNMVLNGSPKNLTAITNSTPSNTSNSTTPPPASTPPTVTASAPITMETGNALVIDRVKITCDTLDTVKEGDTVDNVAPGQTCYLTVKVKNEGSKDMEDIEIEVESDSSDVDGDQVDISSLDAGDSEEKVLELKIEEEAENSKADVTITAKGKDENGASYTVDFSFKLSIERLKHDLPISKITVTPSRVDNCRDTRVDVAVYVENKGRNDEEEAAVELSVPGLNFVKKIDELSIEQDEEAKVTFSVPVSEGQSIGSFQATAKSFFDNVAPSQSKTASIVITRCDEVVGDTVPDPVVQPPRQDEIVVIPPAGQEQTTSGLSGAAILTGILVLGNLIALTVLGVMGYGYFKKPKDPMAEQFEDDKSMTQFKGKDYY